MAAGKARTAKFERVNAILPKMIHSLGMNHKYKVQLIFFYWQKIVGPAIAAQAVPNSVAFGTLTLCAKSSVWANNLMMMKLELMQKINMFIGETVIKDIRFQGHSWNEKDREIESLPSGPNLGKVLQCVALAEEELAVARDSCAMVQDETLRQQLERLYQKNMKLKKLEQQYEWQPCEICGILCPPPEKYCHVCEREQRERTEEKIRQLLTDMPWARYADVYKYIPCSKEMVNRQRIRMLQKAVRKVDPEKLDSIEAKTLVMLYRCIPPEQLTEEIITKTLHRLRNDLPQMIFKKGSRKYPKKQKK